MSEKENNEEKKVDSNIVYIGDKHLSNYITAIMMQFNKTNEVIIKSRGKFTSRAIDISEMIVNRFLEGKVTKKDVKIGSEEFKNEEERIIRVSTIEIKLVSK